MVSISSRLIGAAVAFGSLLTIAGCAAEKPQSTVSRGLESGITSSNGGAMGNSRDSLVTTRP